MFGLIVRKPEPGKAVEAVTLEPGNFMCFFPPWDSGDYST